MSFHLIQLPRRRDAHLVCYAPSAKTKLRGFLRELGIRAFGPNFKAILTPARMKTSLCVYRLAGDAWLRILPLKLPATDWARLAQLGLGEISVGQALPL